MTAHAKAINAIERDYRRAIEWSRRNPLAAVIRRQRTAAALTAYIRAQASM